jgi:hypothetical protein
MLNLGTYFNNLFKNKREILSELSLPLGKILQNTNRFYIFLPI